MVIDTTTITQLTKALKNAVIDAEVIPVESATQGMSALVAKKVDAFAPDQAVLTGLAISHQGTENPL